jgi:hypothetical protein
MVNNLSNDIGYDCTFEMDEFNRPRLREEAELVKNTVLTILFMRPGQYPSLPYLGLNIRDKLYSFYDELDETALARELTEQCQALSSYIQQGDIMIKKMIYRDMPSLIIYVSTASTDGSVISYTNKSQNKATSFYIGISVDELNKLLYNINGRAE